MLYKPRLRTGKKHMAISYYKLRECAAADIFNPINVCTTVKRYAMLTEGMLVSTLGSLSDTSYVVDCGES